jgi:hypothetical protein
MKELLPLSISFFEHYYIINILIYIIGYTYISNELYDVKEIPNPIIHASHENTI